MEAATVAQKDHGLIRRTTDVLPRRDLHNRWVSFGFLARVVLFVGLVTGGLACAPTEPAPTEGDHVPEVSLSGAQLRASYLANGPDLVSPPLAAPDLATVVGVMLEADGPVHLEARGVDESGRPGAWQNAEETWREGQASVARIDLGLVASSVELRLPALDAERVQILTWSAVVPQPLQPLPSPAVATTRSGLSANLQAAGVRTRAQWGARATQCSQLDTVKSRMAVHHTVSPPSSNGDFAARLRQTQAYHMDSRGWCDVGYHFFVTLDGQVWEAREARFLGAHVGSSNPNNVGVVFVGCFTPGDTTCDQAEFGPTTPPEVMIQAGGRMIGLLSTEYGITVDDQRVLGHRDHPGANTGCPGNALYARLADLRAIANGGTTGPTDGSAKGVVWDLSITAGPSDPGNKRLIDAQVRASSGDSTSVRAGDAFWSFDLPPGRYTFTAEAPGYQTATRELEVNEGGETWGSIGLLPETTEQQIPLEVLVYDAAGGRQTPLVGAAVSLRGGAPVLTSSAGLATFTATAGPALITAQKSGFVAASRSVSLGGTTTVRVELALAPVVVPIDTDGGVTPDAQPNPEENGEDGEPMPVGEEEGGCGCSTAQDPSGSWPAGMALLLAALFSRRRPR